MAGRRRSKEAVTRRVGRFVDVVTSAPWVQPLNPGFFKLERLRSASVVKAKGKVKARAK